MAKVQRCIPRNCRQSGISMKSTVSTTRAPAIIRHHVQAFAGIGCKRTESQYTAMIVKIKTMVDMDFISVVLNVVY